MLTHPTVERLRSSAWPAWPTPSSSCRQPERRRASATPRWLGLLVDREATERDNQRLTAGCAMPGCASAPSSRTSTIAPRAASTAPCSRSSPPATGSTSTQNLVIDGPDRRRQILARLRARPQGLPRRPLGPLPARAAAVRRARPGPRRRPLSTAHGARSARVRLLILDDWGPEPLGRRAAPRPAGDRRRPLRPRLDC